MNVNEAIELAKADIEQGVEYREIEHPEHPAQIAYDMERFFHDYRQAPEFKWEELCL